MLPFVVPLFSDCYQSLTMMKVCLFASLSGASGEGVGG